MGNQQLDAKVALKNLLSNLQPIIAFIYEKHEEFNQRYFEGKLSLPLITIEKLNNKTLATYSSQNNLGINNCIKFNLRFIELNSAERILETLLHEMVHQWQDEVLYEPNGGKKCPSVWHNKDFEEKCKEVGITYPGSPCNMPEVKKKETHKYICNCKNDRTGKHLVLKSGWIIGAVCNVCGDPYVELDALVISQPKVAAEQIMSNNL